MKQTIRTQVVRGLFLCGILLLNFGGLSKYQLFAGTNNGFNGSESSKSAIIGSNPGRLPITNSTAPKKVIDQPINVYQRKLVISKASATNTHLATPGSIVISQIYGGGGNSGSTYKNDFIELYNRGGSPVDVTGWSVQYASAGGSTWTSPTSLTGTIPAGGYYLIQEIAGTGGTTNLPTPDAIGTLALSGTSGKVALVNISTPLSVSCPTGAAIVDFVGYGPSATCYEGTAPTAILANATAAIRKNNGCTDDNNNSADFSVAAPTPRNSATVPNICGTLNPSISVTPNPVALTYNLGSGPSSQTITVSANNLSTETGVITVTSSNTAIALSNGGNFNNSITLPYSNSALTSTKFVTQLTSGLSAGTYSTTLALSGGGATFNLPVNGTVVDNSAITLIHSIQGITHLSPFNGQTVSNVQGIVTGLRSNGFYMQDPNPDNDDRTSEGIFIFQNAVPTVPIGASVTVGGTVAEFRSGGASGGNNLTTTQIGTPTITVLSTGNALPAATILGNGGRTIPTQIIEDQAGDVETSGLTFDPANDGIDFYESLEGMLVAINNPVTSGPTLDNSSIWVLADNGANVTGRTPRGGIVISASDFNPERILLYTGGGGSFPATSFAGINVNAGISSLTGVMDYFGGDYEVLPTTALTITPSTLAREVSQLVPTANQLTVATFNVENLDPNDGATKFGNLAARIVNNLRSPDIINLEEIQDNNGATNNGTVDASTTFQTLINAITAAGGPTYSYRQIDPVNGQDGGEPGGNIRIGFLFNAARVTFVDRPGGTSTAAVGVSTVNGQPQLTFSPGRIDPTNPAFSSSRKPLVGEFVFNGQKIFVIANHFNSKGGDQDLFGKTQPPVLSSETQRRQQATIVRDFVSSIQAVDPNASIIVAGDLNDFQFSAPLTILKGSGPTSLTTLIETLPLNEQYTYNFGGNAQVIDHIMVSSGLRSRLDAYDVVHINSEFFDQDSDHDPSVARFTLSAPDLTPIIRLPEASFAASGDNITRNFTVELTELSGQATSSGNIVITITAPLGYTLAFDNTRTTIDVSGGTMNTVTVDNTKWTSTSGIRQLTLTINAGQIISGLGTATLGFSITRTGASSGSTSNLNVNVRDDSSKTYDGNSTNNIFAQIINAQ